MRIVDTSTSANHPTLIVCFISFYKWAQRGECLYINFLPHQGEGDPREGEEKLLSTIA